MNVTLNKERLAERFKIARLAAHSRSVVEAHRFVLLESEGSNYRLTATDGDMLIVVGDDVGDEAERMLLPSAEFQAILQSSTGGEVVISSEGSVKSDGDKWKLSIPSPDAFTFSSVRDRGKSYELDVDQFNEAVGLAVPCVSIGESRNGGICGVRLQLGNQLSVVATDGRRIIKTDIDFSCEGPGDGDADINVPTKLLKAITSLSAGYGELTFALGASGGISFQCGDVTVSGGLINGAFPRWERVFETYPQLSVANLELSALATAVDAAKVTSSDQSDAIKIRIDHSSVNASSTGGELGESAICRSVTTGVAEGCHVRGNVNPTYLLPVLRAIGSRKQATMTGCGQALRLDCGNTTFILMCVD